MEILNPKIAQKFNIVGQIGKGAFGKVFEGKHTRTGKMVAIKYESPKVRPPQAPIEAKVTKSLSVEPGFANVYLTLFDSMGSYIITTLLGENLADLLTKVGGKFSLKTTLMIADQMIERIQNLHIRGYCHRDIKPENVLIGKSSSSNLLHLIDFGLVSQYCDPLTKIHIPIRERRSLVGTARYASINVHKGFEYSRRDDLESIAYMLIYFLTGSLPWQGLKCGPDENKAIKIGNIKTTTSIDDLCYGIHPIFAEFLKEVRDLKFEETPQYMHYRKMFRNVFISMGYIYDYKYDWMFEDGSIFNTTSTIMSNSELALKRPNVLLKGIKNSQACRPKHVSSFNIGHPSTNALTVLRNIMK